MNFPSVQLGIPTPHRITVPPFKDETRNSVFLEIWLSIILNLCGLPQFPGGKSCSFWLPDTKSPLNIFGVGRAAFYLPATGCGLKMSFPCLFFTAVGVKKNLILVGFQHLCAEQTLGILTSFVPCCKMDTCVRKLDRVGGR